MKRSLFGSVVVITGASSGIGRATAIELARRGVNLVLAARREEPLASVVRECETLRARAEAMAVDVNDPLSADALVARALERFGRLDGWINNAGVFCVGSLDETPDELYRQVMETNFFAYVSGAKAAIPTFKRQGAGVLVNVSSVYGRAAGAYVSAYAASKFAVRGFSESLRQELRGTDVHVCTVLPPSIDTPLFEHAANFSGWELRPVEPILRPERVARVIASCLERPRREVTVGAGARATVLLHGLAPALYERLMRAVVDARHFEPRPVATSTGNLFSPVQTGFGISGGYRPAWAAQWPRWTAAAAIALAPLAAYLLARSGRSWRAFG